MTSRLVGFASIVVLFAAPFSARAEDADVDVTKLYELSTLGTTQKLEAGAQGKLVFSVKTVDGAYISDEAPLRLKLQGKNLKLSKDTVTYADSLTRKEGAKPPPDPKFEVPFTAEAKGEGTVDVKATLFICTAKLCVRQQRTVAVPVQVN